MQTSHRTRGVALLVPRLLSIQADPAEHETADALADAVERVAEELLRWHDEIAEIRTHAKPFDSPPPDRPADEPVHSSERLAEQVRAGVIPADPASLEAAASELRSISYAVAAVAEDCAGSAIRSHGQAIADGLIELSEALHDLADTLRAESRRLSDGGPAVASQVLGRIVRAEHAARRVAAATLRV